MSTYSQIVVVAPGNEFRRDDGVGLYVAELLKKKLPDGSKVVESIPDGYALLDTWDKSSLVYIIDCVISGNKPGTIYRFDAINEKIPGDLFDGFSTHSISVVDAIALANVLDRLPRGLFVYGIEGKDWSSGTGLSPEVKLAADKLADEIIDDIRLKSDHDEQALI